MEDGKAAAAAAMAQQQQQQQMMLMQQIQRQKDAISRFPSNIDAHLRPHHHPIHPHRPLVNPNQNQNQNQNQNNNPLPNPTGNNPPPNQAAQQQQQQQQHKASLQLAYQDAWRVCHPDVNRPFSSLEDACDRLLPYHVVADYEAEEDDKILDSATTTTTTTTPPPHILSRSQQWDHNIAAKVAEFTATFEKQVLAFNIISRKRGLGEFRTEEKLMMEQLLYQDEKRALLDLRADMDHSRQKASRETHEANMRMAAMARAEAEMMARAPIRASALVASRDTIAEDDIINGWGTNNTNNTHHKDDNKEEPSEDFLNDDEAENGDASALQTEWPGGGEFDLNAR